jgi:hypothetical protein
VNGEEANWSYEEAGKKLVIRLPEEAGETAVEARL